MYLDPVLSQEEKLYYAEKFGYSIEKVARLWKEKNERFLFSIIGDETTNFETRFEALRSISFRKVEIHMNGIHSLPFLLYVFEKIKNSPLSDLAGKVLCKFASYQGDKYRLDDETLETVALHVAERAKNGLGVGYRQFDEYKYAFAALASLKKYKDYPEEWVRELI